jgi:hypothetical protein
VSCIVLSAIHLESIFQVDRDGKHRRCGSAIKRNVFSKKPPKVVFTPKQREHAGRRGWQISEEYSDQGASGSKESRPA